MNKVIFLAFIVTITGCVGFIDDKAKYEVNFKCKKNNFVELRKLTSSAKLTEEEILWYTTSLENKFGYKEGTCIRI